MSTYLKTTLSEIFVCFCQKSLKYKDYIAGVCDTSGASSVRPETLINQSGQKVDGINRLVILFKQGFAPKGLSFPINI